MRLNTKSVRAQVRTSNRRERPITLDISGLCFALSAREAHRIADELHDAAEKEPR